MTECGSVRHDQWRTVWRCALESGHNGLHGRDGFWWNDEAVAVPSRIPVRATVYTGDRTQLAESLTIVDKPNLGSTSFTPVGVRDPQGRERLVFPGQTVLEFDDQTWLVLSRDEVEARWRMLDR